MLSVLDSIRLRIACNLLNSAVIIKTANQTVRELQQFLLRVGCPGFPVPGKGDKAALLKDDKKNVEAAAPLPIQTLAVVPLFPQDAELNSAWARFLSSRALAGFEPDLFCILASSRAWEEVPFEMGCTMLHELDHARRALMAGRIREHAGDRSSEKDRLREEWQIREMDRDLWAEKGGAAFTDALMPCVQHLQQEISRTGNLFGERLHRIPFARFNTTEKLAAFLGPAPHEVATHERLVKLHVCAYLAAIDLGPRERRDADKSEYIRRFDLPESTGNTLIQEV